MVGLVVEMNDSLEAYVNSKTTAVQRNPVGVSSYLDLAARTSQLNMSSLPASTKSTQQLMYNASFSVPAAADWRTATLGKSVTLFVYY
jgi:hypothetical protein